MLNVKKDKSIPVAGRIKLCSPFKVSRLFRGASMKKATSITDSACYPLHVGFLLGLF
jgi:hypothetical protein